MKTIKILDIIIDDISLLNVTEIARQTDLSQPYVFQLLDPNNKRKNPKALRKVRNAVVELYGSVVRIENYELA